MIERFAGESNRRVLVDSLTGQKLFTGNADLATEAASKGELVEVGAGTSIIQQGGDDNWSAR